MAVNDKQNWVAELFKNVLLLLVRKYMVYLLPVDNIFEKHMFACMRINRRQPASHRLRFSERDSRQE